MNVLKNDSNTSVRVLHAQMHSDVTRHVRPYRPRVFLFGLLLVIFFLVGFGFGVGVGTLQNPFTRAIATITQHFSHTTPPSNINQELDFAQFWRVWNLVKEKYVEQPIDEQKLFYASIAGLVAGLNDPYSMYFNPEQSKEFLDEINGSFEGIGAEIGIKNNQLTVIAPLPDSPAANADLRSGDVILAIDGHDVGPLTVNQAITLIRGQKGTTVTLTILRGQEEPKDIAIIRDTIHVESVKWEMTNAGDKHIAWITLSQFNSDTAQKFREIANALLLQKPDGIVVDLRNNAGGFLDVSVDIASTFISEGQTIVREQAGDKTEKSYVAKGENLLANIPVVVLMNNGSASASEILAGALQDYGLAQIIGTTSFGKGTVQDLQTFEDGSSLKITVARWLTPKGNTINKKGIVPDVVVDRTADDVKNNQDPQRERALLYFSDRTSYDAARTAQSVSP